MKQSTSCLFVALAFAGALSAVASPEKQSPLYRDAKAPVESRVRDLLARMTLEEKVQETILLTCYKDMPGALKAIEAHRVGAFLKTQSVRETRLLQTAALKASRLGIPLMFHEDVIHGFRTMSPVPLASACSWDVDAVEKAERVAAREASAAGLDLGYSPMLDITSDPRWGRVVETNGEDPYLSGRMAAARVKGLQGGVGVENCRKADSIMACPKHFLGYASNEGGLDYYARDFSWRDLQETYVVPYRYAIAAGAGSIMCSYLSFDMDYITFNRKILTGLLRDELKFDGLLMTDWTTLHNAIGMGVSGSENESAARAIRAGTDMDMGSGIYMRLVDLVRSGTIKERLVDVAAGRCLAAKFRAGLFDNPFLRCDEKREREEILSERNRAETLDLTEKSMILLENDGTLPLDSAKKTALVGWYADGPRVKWEMVGSWFLCANSNDTVSVADGMKKLWSERLVTDASVLNYDAKAAAKLIADSGVETVVACFGELAGMSGEGTARATLELPREQIEWLKAVKATGKKVVSVVFAGRPVILEEVIANSDAVLYAWFPGTMGGDAVARILSGKVNPSAKTVQTFFRHAGQAPMTYRRRRPMNYTTYNDIGREVRYPFGYGKSYTTFAYGKPRVKGLEFSSGSTVDVTVPVENTGAVKGREVVQVYVRDEVASVCPRERELKEFKVVELEPGEKRKVTFSLPPSAFETLNRQHKWVVEPGLFTIFAGGDSTTTNAVQVVFRP